MCGINLIIKPKEDGKSTIQKMMQATQHRGPDFSDFCQITDGIWMAGNRLKILDLSAASNQPFWSEDKSCVLVWNGALYNYQDLRNNLLDFGYNFKTNSDSEVLLLWLKHYGSDKISELKGMFAFVFVNISLQQITIARDPSGEKPLYFYQNEETWCFSSESRGVLAGFGKEIRIDKSQFLPYFYSRHSFPDRSFYHDILQYLPGTGLTLDFNGKIVHKFEWTHPKFIQDVPSQEVFESKLKDAILKNFHAERPVGIILSGGADSSLLYRLWTEETGQPVATFTAAFEQKYQAKYNDPVFAKKLTSQFESFHTEVLVTPEKIQKHWQEYIAGMDQPIGDSAGILTWLIAKEAKEKVQVLISGAGADELFGGYTRHSAFAKYLKNPKFYIQIKKLSENLPLPRPYKKFLNGIDSDPERTFLNFASLMNIPEDEYSKFQNWYPKDAGIFQNALNFDRKYYLVNDVLKIHDNVCMTQGIEGRSPYLDFEMIQWTKGFSEDQTLFYSGKKMIKEALEKRGFGKIAKRKKIGFGIPIKEWLQEDESFRKWVLGTIKEMNAKWAADFPQKMQQIAEAPEKVYKDQFLLVWNLFILASWLKNQK